MYYRLCPHCSHTFKLANQTTLSECPRCLGKVGYKKSNSQLLFALVLTCLILYIPANVFPILQINLMGSIIPMDLMQGAMTLLSSKFEFVSIIILISCAIAPFVYLSCLLILFFALKIRHYKLFKFCITVVHYAKHWVMLDVYLLGLGIAIFKLRSYADIYLEAGLYPFIALQMIISYLVLNFSEEEYWDKWQQPREYKRHDLIRCAHCFNTMSYETVAYKTAAYKAMIYKKTNNATSKSIEYVHSDTLHCDRCHHHLKEYWPNSLKNTWAHLICALLFILPANIYPVTVIISMGQNYTDTIMSGVVTLVTHHMILIPFLIFTASIVIPVFKIISLLWILISIKLKRKVSHRRHMKLFGLVQLIGKWSVMDLLVISILTALLDRGQILDFSPGFGAIAFGIVVIFTMFATESFDKRLIWTNAKFNE